MHQAADRGALAVLQGNGSTAAAALSEAIARHNERDPARRLLFLNYSAVDPALTESRCSFWHFRFDAHVDMRMTALVEAIAGESKIRRVALLNQDYAFGRQVAASARRLLGQRRPDVSIVADVLHPLGRVRDFSPYVARIAGSGADAVVRKLPAGYDTMLGRWFQNGRELSAGEWQRVAMARLARTSRPTSRASTECPSSSGRVRPRCSRPAARRSPSRCGCPRALPGAAIRRSC